jgi:hypothetical protein
MSESNYITAALLPLNRVTDPAVRALVLHFAARQGGRTGAALVAATRRVA